MENVAHRKLIDLEPAVFNSLSKEAAKRNISLKGLIEEMLREQAATISHRTQRFSPEIDRLIGSANPDKVDLSTIDDDRLQYILSK